MATKKRNAKKVNKARSSKKASASKKAVKVKVAEAKAPVVRNRSTILGRSTTAIMKWLGVTFGRDVTASDGFAVGVALADGQYAPATVTTGLSDGRSEKYRFGAAKDLTDKEVNQILGVINKARKVEGIEALALPSKRRARRAA